MILTPAEQAASLKLARETLEQSFRGKTPSLPSNLLQEKLPCFVSLHSRGHRLRGCIGCTATEVSLGANIQRMTLAAASEDPRFSPVAEEEVRDLKIEISVLGPLQPLSDLYALKIGTHGLKVAQGRRAGLLLAQVAVEQGWDAAEFMKQTCYKAGLEPSSWRDYQAWYFEQIAFAEN